MIYRVERKENPFVQVDKGFINDKRLGYKEKGILLYFLSKPDGWDFYAEEIASNSSDGLSAVKAGIQKLMDNGYIVRGERQRNEKGQLGAYEYIVKEVSATCENPTQVFPTQGNPTQENPTQENRTLINNDTTNNNITNNKESNINNISKGENAKENEFEEHNFSDEMQEAVNDWLSYKKERHEAYKPTGKKMVLSEIENKLKVYNESDVIDTMRESMANNWKGICWDKLKGKEKPPEPKARPIPPEILRAKEQHEKAMKLRREGKGDWRDLIY